ncbi:MAG TPA: glycosyltransferase family 4 protein [Gaiellales bacterium]|nr:glycosyltransferase family 4 protein [Gaiellales bacterium]
MHVVAPEGFDDPGRPTGGNIYDRRVCAGLAGAGWDVRVAGAAGSWPAVDPDSLGGLAALMAGIAEGETVLVDGLVASPSASALLPHAGRLRLVVLLHMPLATAAEECHDAAAQASERAVVEAAAGVVATSEWTRRQVLERFAVPAGRVHVARPGVDRAEPAPGAGHLLCVGALGRSKGQDLLVEALAELAGLEWRCLLAGALDRDRGFVGRLQRLIERSGLGDRVRLAGVLTGAALGDAYAEAGVVVAPSRSETYGMAVAEALAHGLPVIGAAVGGLPEALGRAPGGALPGVLVEPGDIAKLAAALAGWLSDGEQRRQLRAAAIGRRSTLAGWDQTVREVATALAAGTLRAQ